MNRKLSNKSFAEKNDHSTKVTKRQSTKDFFLQRKVIKNTFLTEKVVVVVHLTSKWQKGLKANEANVDEPRLTKKEYFLSCSHSVSKKKRKLRQNKNISLKFQKQKITAFNNSLIFLKIFQFLDLVIEVQSSSISTNNLRSGHFRGSQTHWSSFLTNDSFACFFSIDCFFATLRKTFYEDLRKNDDDGDDVSDARVGVQAVDFTCSSRCRFWRCRRSRPCPEWPRRPGDAWGIFSGEDTGIVSWCWPRRL